MKNEKILNSVELKKVSGGAGSSEVFRIHSNCGGYVTCEDSGIYVPDVWLTCPKCGKTWHPHSWNRVEQCEDLYTAVQGSY